MAGRRGKKDRQEDWGKVDEPNSLISLSIAPVDFVLAMHWISLG